MINRETTVLWKSDTHMVIKRKPGYRVYPISNPRDYEFYASYEREEAIQRARDLTARFAASTASTPSAAVNNPTTQEAPDEPRTG